MVLNKIYLKVHDGGLTLFYVESNNFQFDIEKVYDKNFNPIKVDKGLFEKSCNLIIRNIMYGETLWLCDDYDIAIGTPVEKQEIRG